MGRGGYHIPKSGQGGYPIPGPDRGRVDGVPPLSRTGWVTPRQETVCHIASARYADLSPDGGGTPSNPVQGGPLLVLDGEGDPIQSWMGRGVPVPVLEVGTPSSPGQGGTQSSLD